jgi:putative endonuclease
MDRTYYVYILASRSRNLYTGVTNSLQRRLAEHREGLVAGHTSKYNIFRLVHFEVFTDIRYAIAREKEIKGWRREKKLWLIEHRNPLWEDLAAEWFANPQKLEARCDAPATARDKTKADPSPPSANDAAGFGMTAQMQKRRG